MAQIKKADRGTILQRQNDYLLQDPSTDAQLKREALAVRDLADEILRAGDFGPIHAARYRRRMQQAIGDILQGNASYSQSALYKPNNLDWQVNETVRRVLEESAREAANEGETSQIVFKPMVTLNPAEGFNSYEVPGMTLTSKIQRFASHLKNKFNEYISNPYNANDYIIRGMSPKQLSQLPSYMSALDTLSKSTGASNNDLLALGDIVTSLGNEDLTSAYERYFADFLGSSISTRNDPPATVTTATTTAVTPEQPESLVSTSEFTVDLDPLSPTYKKVTLKDGRSGNFDDPTFFSSLDADLWSRITSAIREENKRKFPVEDYTVQGGTRGVDLSEYFEGDEPIWWNLDDYNFDTGDLALPYELMENWDNIKSKFHYSGKVDRNPGGLSTANQYALANYFIPSLGITDIPELNDDYVTANFGQSSNENGDINGTGFFGDTTITKVFTPSINTNPDLNNLGDAIKAYVANYIIGNKNYLATEFPTLEAQNRKGEYLGDLFIKQLGENPQRLQAILIAILKDFRQESKSYYNQKEEKIFETIRQLFEQMQSQPASMKQGGILKAVEGNALQKINLGQQTQQHQTSSLETQQTPVTGGNEEFSWDSLSSQDYARLAALAQDLAAAGASNAVGYGTLAAGILGLTSMGTEAWADFTDPNVSTGEALRNVGINTGLSLIGLIPDAKFFTSAGKALKLLARIGKYTGKGAAIFSLGNLGKEDAQRLWQVAKDWSEGKEYKLTKNDARLIMQTLSAILQGRASAKMSKQRTAAQTASGVDPHTRQYNTYGVDANGNRTDKTITMKYGHDNGKGYLDYYDLYKQSGRDEMLKKWREDFGLHADAEFPVQLPRWNKLANNFGSEPSLWNLFLGRGERQARKFENNTYLPDIQGTSPYITYTFGQWNHYQKPKRETGFERWLHAEPAGEFVMKDGKLEYVPRSQAKKQTGPITPEPKQETSPTKNSTTQESSTQNTPTQNTSIQKQSKGNKQKSKKKKHLQGGLIDSIEAYINNKKL